MKQEKSKYNKILLIIILIFVILIVAVLVVFFTMDINNKYPELTQGEIAEDFCIDKCGDNNYYTSYNNSDYNFIKCSCVESAQSIGVFGGIHVQSTSFYFDSQTLEEISKEEVLVRIDG